MAKQSCCYLLPGYFCYIGGSWPHEHPECLLAEGHKGDHLVCFSDGRYFLWSPDEDCGCSPEQLENGECECFIYEEVSEETAQAMIEKK